MPKIHLLDKHTAELIAAGEVVERPSSVVKELMENAIDAGASVISVEIEDGGISLIRISDDGSGIERDDVAKAFLRHATSKVRTEDDLDEIGTLGFRGEALASICAVSRVELLTCTAGGYVGTRYVNEGGEQLLIEDAARPQGTTIVVCDLFYNVPARMKYLKKDVSEANAIAGVVSKIALSHPEVSVRFIRDGKEELLTPGDGQLLSCIYTVFGSAYAKSLNDVDYSLNGIRIYGFVSQAGGGRANRTMQHFFINNRYVKSRTIMAALEQAFRGLVMTGKFPCCVLFLDMPLNTVDVNVHPAKTEVRFVNERLVFDAVYHGVKSAFLTHANLPSAQSPAAYEERPEKNPEQTRIDLDGHSSERRIEDESAEQSSPVSIEMTEKTTKSSPAENASFVLRDSTPAPYNMPVFVPDIICDDLPSEQPREKEMTDDNTIKPEPQKVDYADYIGEAFSTYIIAQMGNSVYLIDKHAAHERILYNKLKSAEHKDAQFLMQPVTVTLSSEEYEAVVPELENLSDLGFEVEDFGGSSVIVRALPMMLDGGDAADIIREISGALASGGFDLSTSMSERIFHVTACRAAVKAGDINKPDELKALAQRVLQSDDIRTCPHGRPVCFELTLRDIEKRFGRSK